MSAWKWTSTLGVLTALAASAPLTLSAEPAGGNPDDDCGWLGPGDLGDYVFRLQADAAPGYPAETWIVHDDYYNAYGKFMGPWPVVRTGVSYYEYQIQEGFSQEADFCPIMGGG